MRIVADQDALARMVARHVGAHHATAIDAARRIADPTPKASDDAAGVSIATRMQARAASAAAAAGNVQDGISLMQVSEGALAAMTAYLDQVRTVAIQAGNDTFGEDQRRALQVGVEGLLRSFDETLRSVSRGHRTIQVGFDAGDTLDIPTGPVGDRTFTVSVLTSTDARSALDVLDEALAELYAQRAEIGAAENRMRRILDSLGATGDRISVDAARRTDADLGKEVISLLTARTWAQTGAAMLGEVAAAGRRAAEILLGSAAPPPEPAETPAATTGSTPAPPPPPRVRVEPQAPAPSPTTLVPEPSSAEMPSARPAPADRGTTAPA
ncbi:MAG: flagellin [Mobilicoccus sp.]|nr:flagellin [Mobilicoccus sp.]